MSDTFYVGTYTGKEAEGIYSFSRENGLMGDPSLFVKIADPKYLCVYKDLLACVCNIEDRAGVALINKEGKIVTSCAYEDGGSCHIASDGERLYTANYHLGTFSVLEYDGKKLVHLSTVLIRDKAGCHQILFHEDKIMVPCLFLDRIMIYDNDMNKTGEIVFPQGTGPRHGVFDGEHRYLYLAGELSNEVFKIDMKDLKITECIPILEYGVTHKEGTAAIRMSEDEKYLYVSTRYEEKISVIRIEDMKLLQVADCLGKHPRDFVVEKDHLICANRFSNEIVSFRLEDGLIKEKISSISVPDGVALLRW